MNRLKLFLGILIFGVILIPNFFNIKSVLAAAPYPNGNATASICAYNHNTIRYVESQTSWPHRADSNYDWAHCGRAVNSYGNIWMPDNATELYIFQVISSSANDVLTLRDVNSNQVLYQSSLNTMPGSLIGAGGGVVKTAGTSLRLNISNLGQRVIRIEGPQGLRAHFNIRKGATTNPPATPQPGTFSLTSASINCSGNQPYGYISWGNSSNATRYEVFRRNTNSSSWQFVSSSRPTTDFYSGFSAGASYRYRVTAYNGASNSAPSRSVESSNLTVPNCNPTPLPPTISATTTTSTCSGTTPRVRVSWTTVSSAASYRIEKVAGGNTQTENLSAAQAASSGYALTQNTTAGSNYHRVYALNSSGGTITSTTTTPVNIASCPPPPPPTTYRLRIVPTSINNMRRNTTQSLQAISEVCSGTSCSPATSGVGVINWQVTNNLGAFAPSSGANTVFTSTSDCSVLDQENTGSITARTTISGNNVEGSILASIVKCGANVIGDVGSLEGVSNITVDDRSVVSSGSSISIDGQAVRIPDYNINWGSFRSSQENAINRLIPERAESLSDQCLSGDFNLNPRGASNPSGGLFERQGDLTICGDTAFSGKGTIVVRGNVVFQNNTKYNLTYNNPETDMLGMIIDGDMTIPAGSKIIGAYFVKGTARIEGRAQD